MSLSMRRIICCFFLSLLTAAAQDILDGNERCAPKMRWEAPGTWSPDCQAYFVNGWQGIGSGEILMSSFSRSTRVFTIRGKRTYLEDPTLEVRRDLAINGALACPFINVEAVKWLGPQRLLLRADVRCGPDNNSHNLLYEVDADHGHIRRFPTQLTQSLK